MDRWHWETCPACNGKGEVEVVTGASYSEGTTVSLPTFRTFTSTEDCECCQRRGRLRIPNHYTLKAAEHITTITIENMASTPTCTPSDTHIKAGLA